MCVCVCCLCVPTIVVMTFDLDIWRGCSRSSSIVKIIGQSSRWPDDKFRTSGMYHWLKSVKPVTAPRLKRLETVKAKFHYASWFGASSELAPNMFGASSELASVMEFGCKQAIVSWNTRSAKSVPKVVDAIWVNEGFLVFSTTISILKQIARVSTGQLVNRIQNPLTRNVANAQRDDRPVEYRWRPLFNAAKFGWCPLLECLSCSNDAKTRNPLKFAGVPQARQQISAVSRPKFTILSGHVEEVLMFNKFFPIIDTCLSSEDIAQQSCAMVPKWRFFCVLYFQRAACSTFHTCILNSH